MHICAPRKLAQELQPSSGHEPVNLIDVRTPAEYQTLHIQGARLIPLHQLSPEKVRATRPAGATGPVRVLCKSGVRAEKACQQLRASGIEAVPVAGGVDAWVTAGLPVVRGDCGISLERQIRLIAGMLVALGTVGGWLVHPWILAVPLLVGSGLFVAGVTNFCGLELLLARMPWNRGSAAMGFCNI